MTTMIIDGKNISDTTMLHQYIASKLCFPDYYGCNLDALHDCLTNIFDQTTITIDNYDILEKKLGPYYIKFRNVLLQSAIENTCLHLTL